MVDETGTVARVISRQDAAAQEDRQRQRRQYERLEARGVADELLRVHGTAPGVKAEGVTRLLYENANGLDCRWTNNWKLDKARGIHDELEADVIAYNEHRLNMRRAQNSVGFSQLFGGREAEIRSVVAHNVHENIGRIQEGGQA